MKSLVPLQLLLYLALVQAAACTSSPRALPGTPSPAVPEESRLRVEVVDGAGAPIAGADVWLIEQSGLDPTRAAFASRVTGDLVATSRELASQVIRSDERGIALLERPSGGAMIAGERGSAFGQAEFLGRPPADVRIQLADRLEFQITVLDAVGTPLAGVPLTLGVQAAQGRQMPELLPVTSLSGEDGVVVLYVPQKLIGAIERSALVVMARIPSRRPTVLTLDAAIASDMILPAVGRLELFAPELGGGPPWSGLIQVFASSDGTRSDTTLAVRLENGYVELPAVEADTDLRISGLISLEGGGAPPFGRLRRRIGGIEPNRTNRVELKIVREELEVGR